MKSRVLKCFTTYVEEYFQKKIIGKEYIPITKLEQKITSKLYDI
jgi:hypothetical protein